MPNTYKILGQAAPAATTETTLYSVPAATQAVISTITVANRTANAVTFRISNSVAAAATANKDYLVYDATIGANSMITFTLGITMGALDVLRVYASALALSFNAHGSEIS